MGCSGPAGHVRGTLKYLSAQVLKEPRFPSRKAGFFFEGGGRISEARQESCRGKNLFNRAGIGSHEAGWYRENVLSARVVLPTGEVRESSGNDLDLIADAEGTTGFITQVTLKVQPLEDLDVISIGSPNAHDLQRLLGTIIAKDLPIWSLMFINPRLAELKNRAPLMEHNGHPVEERVLLPAAYIMTLAFRKKERDAFTGKLTEIMKLCEAEVLSQKISEHEKWVNDRRVPCKTFHVPHPHYFLHRGLPVSSGGTAPFSAGIIVGFPTKGNL